MKKSETARYIDNGADSYRQKHAGILERQTERQTEWHPDRLRISEDTAGNPNLEKLNSGVHRDMGSQPAQVARVNLKEVELWLRHTTHAHAGGQLNLAVSKS